MSAGELMDFAARLFGYLSLLGGIAGLSIWALYAAEQRAAKRRNAFRDARRRERMERLIKFAPDRHCSLCAEAGGCGCPDCAWRADQRVRFTDEPDPTCDRTGAAS
jgi:hypothetical protein